MCMLRQADIKGAGVSEVLIKLPLPPAMAVFLPTVTVTAVAAITIFPVGTTAHG